MNTINFSDKDTNNLTLAENYYYHMLHKNFDAMEKCLHPDVHFIGLLAEISGKSLVVDAAKNLCKGLKDIKIRARFSENEKIMFVYDFFFPEPIGKLRSSGLIEFKDHLISKIELFCDPQPFMEKKYDSSSHAKE